MISFGLSDTMLLNLENPVNEVFITVLALLSELLSEDIFINAIVDIKGLIKF